MDDIKQLEAHIQRVCNLMRRLFGASEGQLSPEDIVHLSRALLVYEGLDEDDRDRAVCHVMDTMSLLAEARKEEQSSILNAFTVGPETKLH